MSANAGNSGALRACRSTAFAFLSLALIAGCTLPTAVLLTNASPTEIRVSYEGESRQIESSTLPPNGTIELKGLLDRHFSIQSGDHRNDYGVELVPEDSISGSGWGPTYKRTVNARLESDQCIYLVSNQAASNGPHGKQPAGFPLCPMR